MCFVSILFVMIAMYLMQIKDFVSPTVHLNNSQSQSKCVD